MPDPFNSYGAQTHEAIGLCQVAIAPQRAGSRCPPGIVRGHGVVLLSTHIVEDVSDLCTRMAIIDQGEILLEAEPLRAIDELHGRIWRRVISKEELPELERQHAVISTKLFAGLTVLHVYSDTAPGPGFEPAEPDLEDVYFSTMAGCIGRRLEPAAMS